MKYGLIIILSGLFIFLLLILNSYTLSDKIISKDLEYSSDYISIYNQNLSESEFNELVNKNKDDVFCNLLVTDYNNYKTNKIKIPVSTIISKYCESVEGDYLNYDFDKLWKLRVNEDFVYLSDLENIEAIVYKGQDIKILDIFNQLKYDDTKVYTAYSYIYQNYEVNRNKVKVNFKNGADGDIKTIVFVHGILGKLKEVQVI